MEISKCKIKKNDQIKPLIYLQNNIKFNGQQVAFNLTILFTRLAAVAQRKEEDIEEFFSHELTQEPMSLLSKGLTRKPDKPSLRKALMKDEDAVTKDQLDADSIFVVDGGALLHRVRWMKGTTFEELCENYVQYVRKHYKTCAVVFDGYGVPSTKSDEHLRRSKGVKKCPTVDVKECNRVLFPQDRFFTDEENKSQFIKLLGQKLKKDDQQIKICEGDADITIIATSLEQAGSNKRTVVTVADDTDVAIMLLFHWIEHHGDVIFLQEKGNKGWNIKDVSQQCQSFQECLLFVHAWSGCDTMSAPFGRGKSNFLNIVKKSDELRNISDIMSHVWATTTEIGEAIIRVFRILYGNKEGEPLYKIRYTL